jgi:hypothetical protein
MQSTLRRFWQMATLFLLILWTSYASAEYCPQGLTTTAHTTDSCHAETDAFIMVKKTFAANCLTLEDDYAEVLRLRDEWRGKYEDTEAQVTGLLVDRKALRDALDGETAQRLLLVGQLGEWQRKAESRFSRLEVFGIGMGALAVGIAAGAGACLIWCP